MMRRALPLLLLLLPALAQAESVRIGSKTFAENYILAEAAALLLEARGFEVERRFGMNGTQILFDALSSDEIDLYPEYTGTISEVILKDSAPCVTQDLRPARGAGSANCLPARVPESAGRLAWTQRALRYRAGGRRHRARACL